LLVFPDKFADIDDPKNDPVILRRFADRPPAALFHKLAESAGGFVRSISASHDLLNMTAKAPQTSTFKVFRQRVYLFVCQPVCGHAAFSVSFSLPIRLLSGGNVRTSPLPAKCRWM
jgi:hypothetical protein